MPDATLLMHPVRLRIVAELARRTRTTGELAEAMPDVAQATLYRHVNALHEGGAIEVADERQVRGAVERTWRVRPGADSVDPAELSELDADEHDVLFTTFTAALLDSFSTAVHAGDPSELFGAGLSYRGAVVHLSDAEHARFMTKLQHLVEEMLALDPAPGRRAHTVAMVDIPRAPLPADPTPPDDRPEETP